MPASEELPLAPPQARTRTGIKVRALRMIYYDNARRREGDVFLIKNESEFSARSMEYVHARTPERITTGPEDLRKQHDEIMQSRRPAVGLGGPDDEGDNPLGSHLR